jgi:HEAT repeat protein
LGEQRDTQSVAIIAAGLDADRGVALAAVHALVRLGPEGQEPLLKALEHADPEVQHRAAAALGQTRDAGIRRRLLASTARSPDRNLRAAALGSVDSVAPEARTPELVTTILKDGRPDQRGRAIEELVRFGTAAIKPVAGLLKADDGEVRLAAVSVLARINDPATVPHFLGALKDARGDVRARAVDALVQRKAQGTAKAVAALVSDEDPFVREAVVRALAACDDPAAAAAISTALADRDWRLRHLAVASLAKAPSPAALEPLAKLLADPHWRVRQAAAAALARADKAVAVPELITALSDEHWYVRHAAQASLKALTKQDFGQDSAEWRRWWKQQP